MKKTLFFKLFLFTVLATFVTFTSCKNYDDDIDKLDTELASLRSTVESIQQKIEKGGATITGVETTDNGLIIKLSDGKTYTLTNGAAGKDGSVITIGANGNWFIDGVDTGKASKGATGDVGAPGSPGAPGAPGKDGVYYTPGEDGFWHKHDGETVTPTEDSWITESEGGITAKWIDGYVVLYNVEGSDEPITLGLAGMNNLVFVPNHVTEDGASVLNFATLITTDEGKILQTTAQYQVSPTNASENLIDKDNLYFKYNNPEVVKTRAEGLNPKAEFESLEDGILTVRASIDADALEGLEEDGKKIIQLMLVVPSTSGSEVVSDYVKVVSVDVVEIVPVLTVSPESLEKFSDKGEDVTFTIDSNNDEWEISDLPEWLIEKEKTATSLTLTVTPNLDEERTVSVTFHLVAHPAVTKIIEVTQAAFETPILEPHIYVKTTGVDTNDGSSWEAATTLSKALEMMEDGDNIHIAAGTYLPTKMLTGGAEEGDKTFEINKNVTLIGGYPADASQGAVANKANETILSGDEKFYHTVTITAPIGTGEKVTIKNLAIKNGNAAEKGAGVISVNGHDYLRDYGGGLSIGASDVEFIDCLISDNISRYHAGGIYIHSDANVKFVDSDIINNKTINPSSNCGGLWNAATTTLIGCNILDNYAVGVSGGIYNYEATKQPVYLYMYNSTVARNKTGGAGGGGIYARESSYTRIVNSTFYKNESGAGGGLALYGAVGKESLADIINSTFYSNNSGGTGGGINTVANTTLNLHNSIVTGNTSTTGDFNFVGNSTKSYMILGDKVLDKDGNEVAGKTFDHTTMISDMATNGTCMITGSSPAATLGMDATLLQTLASTFTPAIDNGIITNDQLGTSRSGKFVMGAVVPKITGDGSGETPKLPPVIW